MDLVRPVADDGGAEYSTTLLERNVCVAYLTKKQRRKGEVLAGRGDFVLKIWRDQLGEN